MGGKLRVARIVRDERRGAACTRTDRWKTSPLADGGKHTHIKCLVQGCHSVVIELSYLIARVDYLIGEIVVAHERWNLITAKDAARPCRPRQHQHIVFVRSELAAGRHEFVEAFAILIGCDHADDELIL